jgi:hypothetical protein
MNSNVTMCNDLEVKNTSRLRNSLILTGGGYLDRCDITSNLIVGNNTLVYGSMSVNGNFYNPRIGLGYMGNYLSNVDGADIIQAQNYNDNSDFRIKTNIRDVNDATNILKNVSIKTFNYNYGVDHEDAKVYYGVIAQDIESVNTDLVYQTRGYLPDIMKDAICNGVTLTFDEPVHDLQQGRKIKLINKASQKPYETFVVSTAGDRTIQIDSSSGVPPGRYLVYGRETNDLKNVDYKQLFVLALGAIKELEQRVCQLEEGAPSHHAESSLS